MSKRCWWCALVCLWIACAEQSPSEESEGTVKAETSSRADAGKADAGTSKSDAGRSDAAVLIPNTPSADGGESPDDDGEEDEGEGDTEPGRDAGPATGSDAGTGGSDAAIPSAKGVVVGYYPAWATYTRDYQVAEIPAAQLTHVNYAFANIENGGCVLGDAWADVQKTFPGDNWDESSANQAGNFKQLRKLREQNPKLRTLISVGGWTWSAKFSDAALTADARAKFASSCVDFMVQHGFDGLDIDWEYPVGGGLEGNTYRNVDKQNYTLLLRALRAKLVEKQRALGRSEPYLLTIAAPAGPTIIPNLEAKAIGETVDWINVMSYDFHGSWEKKTGHNAPLHHATGDALTGFDVENAIDAYLVAGVPASRLVMGVPFYGRSWAGVSAGSTHGLHQTASGAGPGTWENGVLDYHDIVARYLNAGGFVRYEDASADVPYLFNAQTGVFITYDDPASLTKKAAFARSKSLAGTMIWDLSSDTADSRLIGALRAQ